MKDTVNKQSDIDFIDNLFEAWRVLFNHKDWERFIDARFMLYDDINDAIKYRYFIVNDLQSICDYHNSKFGAHFWQVKDGIIVLTDNENTPVSLFSIYQADRFLCA